MKAKSTGSISTEFSAGLAGPASSDRAFFLAMALAVAATVIVAFTAAFLKTDLATQLVSTWVKAHVAAFSCWILLFLTQTALVASHRTDIHRRLGVAGAILAGLMIALTVQISAGVFRQGRAMPGLEGSVLQELVFYVVPHVDIILFTVFVTAGILLRGKPEIHKRLMFLATIALLDAVADRLPVIWRGGRYAHFLVQDLFVAAGIINDLMSRQRVNPVYIWGGLLILICPPGAVFLYHSVIPENWGMILNFKP
jgi:hypothetical protein